MCGCLCADDLILLSHNAQISCGLLGRMLGSNGGVADALHTRRRLCKHWSRPELELSMLQQSETTGGWDVDEAWAINCFSFWQGQLTTGSSLSPAASLSALFLTHVTGWPLQATGHATWDTFRVKTKIKLAGLRRPHEEKWACELNDSHVIKRPFV